MSPDTPMIASQSGNEDGDSRALRLRDATLYRRLVAKLNYLAIDRQDIRCAASIMRSPASSPKDARYGQNSRRVVRFLTWATDRLDALPLGGCDQTTSWHTPTAIRQKIEKTSVQ